MRLASNDIVGGKPTIRGQLVDGHPLCRLNLQKRPDHALGILRDDGFRIESELPRDDLLLVLHGLQSADERIGG